MSLSAAPPQNLWRRFTAAYARLLTATLAMSVAILVIPVTLQVISRYTDLIPAYIWTEEMARFLFVWMVMIGAMVGVREGSHFDVDIWPTLGAKANALLQIVSGVFILMLAAVFLWAGWEFTRFAWNRVSELADLPLWLIHVAWPVTGFSWIVFLGEQVLEDLRIMSGRVS